MHSAKRQSGQAAVETALVMPMFLFLFLGLLQLGLAHQARLMARYAAYKAVRAGALQRAQKSVMTNAALAAWVPMAGRTASPSFYKAASVGDYAIAWAMVKSNTQVGGLPVAEVTICNPLSSQLSATQDFDDPIVASGKDGDWQGFTRTRLHAQVTFFYRLVIPFANGVLWYAAAGVDPQQHELMQVLRMRAKNSDESGRGAKTIQGLKTQATAGNYILPIRANYAMRMQSNVVQGQLPGQNRCRVNFKKQSNADHTERELHMRKLNE